MSVDLARFLLEPHTVLLQEMSECGFGWIASGTPHHPVHIVCQSTLVGALG